MFTCPVCEILPGTLEPARSAPTRHLRISRMALRLSRSMVRGIVMLSPYRGADRHLSPHRHRVFRLASDRRNLMGRLAGSCAQLVSNDHLEPQGRRGVRGLNYQSWLSTVFSTEQDRP